MNLFFGQVPQEYQDDGDYFYHKDQPYYYKLSVDFEGKGRGTFNIEDTCGRSVPMDFDQLDELITVLLGVSKYNKAERMFNDSWRNFFSQ